MKSVHWMLMGAATACAMSAAHAADLTYTFDADAQGFTVNEPAGELTHVAPGYLRIKDLTDATNVQLILPAAATGDWSAYNGGTLSFDARLESPISAYWPEFGALTLTSSQGAATLDVVPDGQPGLDWQTYTVKLDAATWSKDAASFAAILANLQRVEINMEAGNGAIETIHVDNVKVTSAVPEPSTWALSLIGLGLMGAVNRRRRRAVNRR